MNKISKICGIFAVGTMMLSTFFVTSCNSEDDFDFGPDSQYSLAERKMTRSYEGPNIDENEETRKTQNISILIDSQFEITGTVSWTEYFSDSILLAKDADLTINTFDGSDKYTWKYCKGTASISGSVVEVNIEYSYSYWEQYLGEDGYMHTRNKIEEKTYRNFFPGVSR